MSHALTSFVLVKDFGCLIYGTIAKLQVNLFLFFLSDTCYNIINVKMTHILLTDTNCMACI